MDDNLAAKFEAITRTILSNQTQALTNLTMKVEKEIGQVWRQMAIMYGQLSNSIGILEKVSSSSEIVLYPCFRRNQPPRSTPTNQTRTWAQWTPKLRGLLTGGSIYHHHHILPQDVRGGREPQLHAEPAESSGVGVQPGEDGPGAGDGGDGGGSPGRVQEAAGGKHPSTPLRNICGPAFASYSLGYALILMH